MLAEMDAEAYFTRKGRTTLREMIEQDNKKPTQRVAKDDPYFHAPWDEAKRRYERDVDAGGSVHSREAERLAKLVMKELLGDAMLYGKLLNNCWNMCLNYNIHYKSTPELAEAEITVLIYGVLSHTLFRWNNWCNPKNREGRWADRTSTRPRGYFAKEVSRREYNDEMWMKRNN